MMIFKSGISRRRPQPKPMAAFTMIELAIVLGVAAIITGGIWSWAAAVWENYEVSTAMQQIVKSVDNIRAAYTAAQNWAQVNSAYVNDYDLTQTLDKGNLLPTEMRRPPNGTWPLPLDHAMSHTSGGASPTWGSFHVLAETNAVTLTSYFRLQLMGLKQSECTKLLMGLPLASGAIGIARIQVTGASAHTPCTINNGVASGVGVCSSGVTPMLLSTTQTWCDATTSINEVDLDFTLHN